MSEKLKLMCILAHPDDESLGTGGTLARYAAEGVDTYVLLATRGQRGWLADPASYPGPEALGALREREVRAATARLGVRGLEIMGYMDGELDRADPQEVIGRIVHTLRRERPQVVITFDPAGAYGHPDHIAISQFATAAIVAAADSTYPTVDGAAPHRVEKLYYLVNTQALVTMLTDYGISPVMEVDGGERRLVAWKDWAITTRLDTERYWRTAWEAATCHASQMQGYAGLEKLSEAEHRHIWGRQNFYRAFSLVNGGRTIETDLFEGIGDR